MNYTFPRYWLLYWMVSMISAVAGPKLLPVLNRPIADRSGLAGFPLTVNLAPAFGMEAIDDQVVRFTSQFSSGGVALVMDMALFANRTPITRQNFLNYVVGGRYVNSFIHRSVPGFVIQGGGFRYVGGGIASVVTNPAIVNEFGVSNTIGTVSMAKFGGDANSATSQWFVSLGANTDNLDFQNGGFTVFARMTKSTLGNAKTFGNPSVFPVYNAGAPFTDLPLYGAAVIPDDLILFPTVSLVALPSGQAGEDSTLVYTVLSNSNPALATASIQPGGSLSLSPSAGQSGIAVLTVRATDSVGNTVDDSFSLAVNLTDTYATWASRSFFPDSQGGTGQNPDGDAWDNLQEFAFSGDPAVSSPASDVVVSGFAGTAPAARYLTLTFPVRKFTQGLSYAVEANDGLSGAWTEIWNSADGFSQSQVVTILDLADRTVVTVKDTAAIGNGPKRFLRIRVLKQ